MMESSEPKAIKKLARILIENVYLFLLCNLGGRTPVYIHTSRLLRILFLLFMCTKIVLQSYIKTQKIAHDMKREEERKINKFLSLNFNFKSDEIFDSLQLCFSDIRYNVPFFC